MRWDRGSQVADCTTLLDVLLMLKYKTMLDTNVATLGIVGDIATNNGIAENYDESRGYGVVNIKPIPTMEGQKSYTIQAYFFDKETQKLINPESEEEKKKAIKGKVVLVVFCDRDFIRNLTAVKVDAENPVKETKMKQLHSLKYGVLVKTL